MIEKLYLCLFARSISYPRTSQKVFWLYKFVKGSRVSNCLACLTKALRFLSTTNAMTGGGTDRMNRTTATVLSALEPSTATVARLAAITSRQRLTSTQPRITINLLFSKTIPPRDCLTVCHGETARSLSYRNPIKCKDTLGYFGASKRDQEIFLRYRSCSFRMIPALVDPNTGGVTMTMRSEEIRLRYLYRRLIIDGKAKISFEAAMRLVGPDCAYHLYSSIAKTNLGAFRGHQNRTGKRGCHADYPAKKIVRPVRSRPTWCIRNVELRFPLPCIARSRHSLLSQAQEINFRIVSLKCRTSMGLVMYPFAPKSIPRSRSRCFPFVVMMMIGVSNFRS